MTSFYFVKPATIICLYSMCFGTYASQTYQHILDKSYAINADYYKLSDSALKLNRRISYLNWLAKNYSWVEIQAKRLYRLGDNAPEIRQIKARLKLLGDGVHRQTNSTKYTSEMEMAVKRFQARHGLKVDGLIGPNTMKWLNAKPQKKAELLSLNMDERIKFLDTASQRYILVNIPAYQLLLQDEGRVTLTSRVIVGKPLKPTPVLNSAIRSVVINPTWRVPRSILEDDVLPKLKLNGDFFNQKKFKAFNYKNKQVLKKPEEWSKLAYGKFPYRIEQSAGAHNALGKYKFYFPNAFSVYLHDTANKHLFESDDRALSSGCIRVENIDELANWMASNMVKNTAEWHTFQTMSDKTKWFRLKDKLPVHLVYWTAWIDESGLTHYRDDIYGYFN